MPLELSPEERRALAPFLDAVARQVAYGLGADPHSSDAESRAIDAEKRAVSVLRDAGAAGVPSSAEAFDAAARRLLAEPPMLAAFFQNLDLLFEHRAAGAEAVARLLMRAMEL